MKCKGLKACTIVARVGMANSSVSMMDRRGPVLWWCRLWMWRHWAPRWWCRADPATSCHPANEYSGHQPQHELFSQTFLHLHPPPSTLSPLNITYNVTRSHYTSPPINTHNTQLSSDTGCCSGPRSYKWAEEGNIASAEHRASPTSFIVLCCPAPQ